MNLDEIRECYKCGEKFGYKDFLYQFQRRGMVAKIGRGLIREIWRNPIFIIQCCWCFAKVPSPTVIKKVLESSFQEIIGLIERH